MKHSRPVTQALTTTSNPETEFIQSQPELWGIKIGDRWYFEDGGVVFHTEYAKIAAIMVDKLVSSSPPGTIVTMERIQ